MNSLYSRIKFRYQKYAIRNLPIYASVLFAIGYLMLSTSNGSYFYSRYLAFYPYQVLHGQIWRIVTAILYPPVTGGIFNAVLGILIYYSFATTVNNTMGAFDFNVYFFGSLLIGELGSIVYYLATGVNQPFIPLFTHFSIFMAFAILYAESTVLLFFIIPIKTKYIAIFELAVYTFYFIVGSAYYRVAIVAALIPIYLFYRLVNNGGSFFGDIRGYFRNKKRQQEWRDQWR